MLPVDITLQGPDSLIAGDRITIDTIIISGNKITKEKIIFRELMFSQKENLQEGDLDTLILKSRQNLLNTSLFNFVTIYLVPSAKAPGSADLHIDVIERWYVWPIPILKLADRNFNVWWETRNFSRFSYGVTVDWRNFRGMRENLITSFQFGYDEQVDLRYLKPYINKKQTLGLGFGVGFARNREVAFETYKNKQQFYQQAGGYARQNIFSFFQFTIRKNIYNSHDIILGFNRFIFSDSLISLNGNYAADSTTRMQYLSLDYKYKSDHRDFKPYPLTGYYFDVEFIANGLGFLSENPPDFFYVTSTFRKYWQFHPRIYYATGLNAKFSGNGGQTYLLTRAIGYDRDIVRGYEYYVVDGQNFGIFKSNLKFAIIPQKTSTIDFIRTEKFSKIYYALYMNLFFDAGYADSRNIDENLQNSLQNTLLIGYGFGIDFVTYYDIVIRLEFSLNKMGESGIFLNFRAPI
jgi:outer membrane protein assembly factor BamA